MSQTCGDPCSVPVTGYFDEYINGTTGENEFGFIEGAEFNFNSKLDGGFNPLGYKPDVEWYGVEFLAAAGRLFADNTNSSFKQYKQAKFWLDIDAEHTNAERTFTQSLGSSDTKTGTDSTLLTMTKIANVNHIGFNLKNFRGVTHFDDEAETVISNTCNPDSMGHCRVDLNWYTDDAASQLPLKIFFKHDSMQDFTLLEPNLSQIKCLQTPPTAKLVSTHQCKDLLPGTYDFQLRRQSYEQDASGNYQYITIAESSQLVYEACTQADNCTYPDPKIDPDALIEVDKQNDQTVVILDSKIQAHNPGAGPIPGSGGVSGGAATYQLPLVIPPGRNGMTPSVSVNYSSKGGNGIMGVGWSVSIGSSIYRCPQTFAQDGNGRSVTLDDTDRLCLDGQRLMLVNGATLPTDKSQLNNPENAYNVSYWENSDSNSNSVTVKHYKTEQDSFVQVFKTASGFTVKTKSGRINKYQQLQSQQTTWYLISEEDSFGNNIGYDYLTFGENEILVNDIKYTGKNGVFDGTRRVHFEYADRVADNGGLSDYKISYNFGEKTERTQKLVAIETYVPSRAIHDRRYDFIYQASKSNGDLLLSKIDESTFISGTDYATRELLDLSWTDDQWSDTAWLDKTENNFHYSKIDNISNQNIVGDENAELLGRAQISHDYNGDGIKDYLATSRNGSKRSLFFFDENNQVKLKINLPTFNSFGYNSRVYGSTDLNNDGYTDLFDSQGLYSWINAKTLPTIFEEVSEGNIGNYFNVNTTVASNLLAKVNSEISSNTNSGLSVIADSQKTQFYFSDYDKDGDSDLFVYATPKFNNIPNSTNICNFGDTPNIPPADCKIEYAKIILFQNITDCGTQPCQNNAVNFDISNSRIVIDDLEPFVDREREVDIWDYIWDSVNDIDDYNGDGYPDIFIKRWGSVALFNEYDRLTDPLSEKIYFGTIDESNDLVFHSRELKDLGLSNFTCTRDTGGVQTTEDCNILDAGISYTKAYHLTDVNADGLKDFVYYDRTSFTGSDSSLVKSWKVRLNQGGGYFDENGFNGILFDQNFDSDINSPANNAMFERDFECKKVNGLYVNSTTNTASTLARKCNPHFRAANKFEDIDSDGIPEITFADPVTSEIGEPQPTKPKNMVFNHCSTFRVNTIHRVNSVTNPTTNDFSASGSSDCTDPVNNLQICQIQNLIPRNSSLDSELAEELFFDPALYNASFYPYTEFTQPNYSVIEPGFVDFFEDEARAYIGLNRAAQAGGNIELVSACSYNGNQLIGYQGISGSGIAVDIYNEANYGHSGALADKGVYRFNAIKFDLLKVNGSNQLKLTLSEDTGIYKQLYSGSVADLTGDGISDNTTTIGCIFGSQYCKNIILDQEEDNFLLNQDAIRAGSWNVADINDQGNDDYSNLFDYGRPLAAQHIAEMPNMLASVTKHQTGQWISWDYHPISAKLIDREDDFPLYSLPERGDGCTGIQVNCDGYINEVGAQDSHFYFNSSMYVVSQMRQSTNLYNSDASNQEDKYAVNNYAYQEAVYNNQGRGFQGFRKISIQSVPDNSDSLIYQTQTESTFHQIFPLAGKLQKSLTKVKSTIVDDTIISEQSYCYRDQSDESVNSCGSSYDLSVVTGDVVYYPLFTKETRNYELNHLSSQSPSPSPTSITKSEMTHDNYGNVLEQKSEIQTIYIKGAVTIGSKTEKSKTTNTYDYSSVTDWWIDKLDTTSVTKTIQDESIPDANSNLTNAHETISKFIWKNGTNDALRKLDCQLTKIGTTLSEDCNSDINTNDLSRNVFSYDAFGNITQVKTQAIDNDLQVTDRIVTTEYSADKYFPVSIKKPTGVDNKILETDFVYDITTGQVKQTITPDNIQLDNVYDSFGFNTSQKVADTGISSGETVKNPESITSMINCLDTGFCDTAQAEVKSHISNLNSSGKYDAYSDEMFITQGVPKLIYALEQRQNGQPQSLTFYDNANNAVLTKTWHSLGQTNSVINITNPMGILEVSTQPYANISEAYSTIQIADSQGRVIEKITEVGDLTSNQSLNRCRITTVYDHEGG
ncbi:MAG: SpvB/TcaC N-terminal domain-containing protein, partial [Marinicellaceae bacterium]